LLIDEHLSPLIVKWCSERRGLYAVAAAHVGLSGQTDLRVWQYAFEHDFVVVTANARDFIALLDVELHPGLIVLREGNLSRSEQWERLEMAIDRISQNPDTGNYMINRVVEVHSLDKIRVRKIPAE
jgi:predicted nuclease of predicted toxin-antitoxin system